MILFSQLITLWFTSESGMEVYKVGFFRLNLKTDVLWEDTLNFLKGNETIGTGWIWTRETSLGKNGVTLGHHVGLLNKHIFIGHH